MPAEMTPIEKTIKQFLDEMGQRGHKIDVTVQSEAINEFSQPENLVSGRPLSRAKVAGYKITLLFTVPASALSPP